MVGLVRHGDRGRRQRLGRAGWQSEIHGRRRKVRIRDFGYQQREAQVCRPDVRGYGCRKEV